MGWGAPTVQDFNDYSIISRFILINKYCDFKGKRVLDIGCGNGIYSIEMAKKAKCVQGIDINENTHDASRNRPDA